MLHAASIVANEKSTISACHIMENGQVNNYSKKMALEIKITRLCKRKHETQYNLGRKGIAEGVTFKLRCKDEELAVHRMGEEAEEPAQENPIGGKA